MESIKIFKFGIFILLAGALFAACVAVGELKEETRTIALDNAESVNVELKMGAGELKLEGGARELMEGHFSYNIDHWKPEIDYHLVGKRGILSVRQGKSHGIPVGNEKNKWEIYLKNDIPLDLKLKFGAGEGKIDLREMTLNSLAIDMGVGEMTLDLSGERKKSLDVTIDGGIGHGTLYLPENLGVKIRIDGGIGSVNAAGFSKSGHVYTNDAYGKTDVLIDINIDAGIGSIDLKLR